jgi:hypothetical protein
VFRYVDLKRAPCRSEFIREAAVQPIHIHRLKNRSRMKWNATPVAPTEEDQRITDASWYQAPSPNSRITAYSADLASKPTPGMSGRPT